MKDDCTTTSTTNSTGSTNYYPQSIYELETLFDHYRANSQSCKQICTAANNSKIRNEDHNYSSNNSDTGTVTLRNVNDKAIAVRNDINSSKTHRDIRNNRHRRRNCVTETAATTVTEIGRASCRERVLNLV